MRLGFFGIGGLKLEPCFINSSFCENACNLEKKLSKLETSCDLAASSSWLAGSSDSFWTFCEFDETTLRQFCDFFKKVHELPLQDPDSWPLIECVNNSENYEYHMQNSINLTETHLAWYCLAPGSGNGGYFGLQMSILQRGNGDVLHITVRPPFPLNILVFLCLWALDIWELPLWYRWDFTGNMKHLYLLYEHEVQIENGQGQVLIGH